MSFRERLVLDNYHGERGFHLIEMADLPGNDLFQLVHAVGGDLRHNVVYSIDHVSFLNLGNRFQFLNDLVFGPNLSVYQNESHRHFLKQPSWWSELFSFKLSAESCDTNAE